MTKISTNSNKNLVASIRKELKQNDGYCPCAVEKTPDTKCMCKQFRDMIERGEVGECHCGLYVIEKNMGM